MKNFERVLQPGTVEEYAFGKTQPVAVFVKVKLEDGRLSITGVVGPRSNGDAWGSCGQITDTLARPHFMPGPSWDEARVEKLRTLWERWHLNDMRPECPHQRARGWYDKAGTKVKLYHWRLDQPTQKAKDAAKEAALEALEKGETFTPSPAQLAATRQPYEKTTHTPKAPAHYEPRTALYPGAAGPVEEKGLGWLYEKEHPEGLLCRPCPECGYKYGSEWKTEAVPEDVLEFLAACPEATTRPAWC